MSTRVQLHQFLVSREFGGGAEIAVQLASRIRMTNSGTAQVWVPGEGRAAQHVRALGLPLAWYSGEAIFSRSRLRAGVSNLWTGLRLRQMGRGLVHIHSPHHYAALRHAFRLAGVKRVLHIHLDFSVEDLRWALRTPPDLIITCARFLIDGVRQALPPHVRDTQLITAVPNAVNLDKFAPSDKRAAKHRVGASADRPLLLMMANLAPHKGQLTAIRAVKLLAERNIDVQLWLAGADRSPDQVFESQILRHIDELGLHERVALLGFRQDGPDLLRAADAVLLPSTSEGLPLSLLEAQACRCPVIAAPTAGVPEIVQDGETGFLVAADNPAGYASRIELLMDHSDIREQIVARAEHRCRSAHGWDAYHQRISTLYSQVLAG